jgi:hypothetical protein
MCAINVKQCILHGKYNNSLTFVAQIIAGETPLDSALLSHKNDIPIRRRIDLEAL